MEEKFEVKPERERLFLAFAAVESLGVHKLTVSDFSTADEFFEIGSFLLFGLAVVDGCGHGCGIATFNDAFVPGPIVWP